MDFYPAAIQPPEELRTADFLLRPLRATDVDLDYQAVMENPAVLRLSGGGTWPADDFTREENLADLLNHEKEHEAGVAFTYTMMTPDRSKCLGCVYVNQLSQMHQLTGASELVPDTFDDRQAIVRFWVRQSRIRADLDWRLLKAMIDWFKDEWRFNRVYFRAHADDERQRGLMKRAKLALAYYLEVPGRQGPFLAYGPVGSGWEKGTP